jgi:cell division protein FtsQ
LGKTKKNKPPRANRYKKAGTRHRGSNDRGLIRRLALFMKLGGLMAVVLTLSAVFMLAYAAVTRSDYFKIESVVVEGHSRLSRMSVIAQAGLEPGQNLLAVNLHLVHKRLLSHDWIADAQVSREIPDTLSIHIREHQPLAIVDMGRCFLLNKRGHIFKELGDEDIPDLPVIKGIGLDDLSSGKNDLSPAMQAVMQGLALGRSHPSIFGGDRIGCLQYDYELGVTLISRKHQRAYQFGFAPFEAKFNRLARLVPRLSENNRWRQYRAVDVNNPDRIVVQLGSTPITTGDI